MEPHLTSAYDQMQARRAERNAGKETWPIAFSDREWATAASVCVDYIEGRALAREMGLPIPINQQEMEILADFIGIIGVEGMKRQNPDEPR